MKNFKNFSHVSHLLFHYLEHKIFKVEMEVGLTLKKISLSEIRLKLPVLLSRSQGSGPRSRPRPDGSRPSPVGSSPTPHETLVELFLMTHYELFLKIHYELFLKLLNFELKAFG